MTADCLLSSLPHCVRPRLDWDQQVAMAVLDMVAKLAAHTAYKRIYCLYTQLCHLVIAYIYIEERALKVALRETESRDEVSYTRAMIKVLLFSNIPKYLYCNHFKYETMTYE